MTIKTFTIILLVLNYSANKQNLNQCVQRVFQMNRKKVIESQINQKEAFVIEEKVMKKSIFQIKQKKVRLYFINKREFIERKYFREEWTRNDFMMICDSSLSEQSYIMRQFFCEKINKKIKQNQLLLLHQNEIKKIIKYSFNSINEKNRLNKEQKFVIKLDNQSLKNQIEEKINQDVKKCAEEIKKQLKILEKQSQVTNKQTIKKYGEKSPKYYFFQFLNQSQNKESSRQLFFYINLLCQYLLQKQKSVCEHINNYLNIQLKKFGIDQNDLIFNYNFIDQFEESILRIKDKSLKYYGNNIRKFNLQNIEENFRQIVLYFKSLQKIKVYYGKHDDLVLQKIVAFELNSIQNKGMIDAFISFNGGKANIFKNEKILKDFKEKFVFYLFQNLQPNQMKFIDQQLKENFTQKIFSKFFDLNHSRITSELNLNFQNEKFFIFPNFHKLILHKLDHQKIKFDFDTKQESYYSKIFFIKTLTSLIHKYALFLDNLQKFLLPQQNDYTDISKLIKAIEQRQKLPLFDDYYEKLRESKMILEKDNFQMKQVIFEKQELDFLKKDQKKQENLKIISIVKDNQQIKLDQLLANYYLLPQVLQKNLLLCNQNQCQNRVNCQISKLATDKDCGENFENYKNYCLIRCPENFTRESQNRCKKPQVYFSTDECLKNFYKLNNFCIPRCPQDWLDKGISCEYNYS